MCNGIEMIWDIQENQLRVILIPPLSSLSREIPGFGIAAEHPGANLSSSCNISIFKHKFFKNNHIRWK